MKALINILNYMLLLLMILIASCTEDAAEVDNLVRGEEYVTVRMHVPGMKNATTRADGEPEDNLTSIWALVFRNGKLQSKTEVTTAASTLNPTTSTTGTFNLSRPKVDDVIHFLGNVPSDVTLPDVGDDESALCDLETGEREKLSYWGKATYTGSDISVTLYRHLAKITIAAGDECTFPEDELFIAGLINANQRGKLVPYKGGFNFDLDSHDYCTLPTKPNPLDKTPYLDNNGEGLKNWLYVFEHDNPATSAGLYVICKIGKYYYKVALTSDGETPYKIIRNHNYTILVNDLPEGTDYDTALTVDPINLEVKEMKDVTLTITPAVTSLQYGETSTEQVTVTVGGLQNVVETLTFTAPGYTILSDYAESAGEGVFTITDTSLTEIDFTLTLTDPSQAGTISVTGGGEYVNSCNTPSTSIGWNKRQEVNGETVMWQGYVKMHVPEGNTKHAAKIGIPYSFFFDENGNAKIPVGSTVRVESSGGGWLQAFNSAWESVWDFGQNGNNMTLTQEVLDKIKTAVDAWGLQSAFVLQGGDGRVLTKVTLIPAKESITAEADKSQLYYDSDDAQVVTVNVTVPDGVQTLNIGGATNFTIEKTAGDGTLNGTTYTMNSERTATFTFTLNAQNVTTEQVITFSDPSESVNSDKVRISMTQTPMVKFTNTGNQTIKLNGTPLSVTMTGVPDGKTLSDFSITVNPTTGLDVAQDGNKLTLTGGVYSTTSGVSREHTFTFTPSATGTYTITFAGSGTDVNMPDESNRTITLTVEAAAATTMSVEAVNGDSTIDLDNGDTYVTLRLTKPTSQNSVKVTFDANTFIINDNSGHTSGDYWLNNNSDETVEFKFALRNNDVSVGDYTVTFVSGDNQMTATATITIKKTPTVSFSNTKDQTLYWNNGSPTSFSVEMTGVPDGGNVSLNIANASAFTITASSGTLTSTDDGYSYTGGNTTFTITPKDANSVSATAYTISITGSGEGVKVPDTSIKVTVENEKPTVTEIVIYDGGENGLKYSWPGDTPYDVSLINDYVGGKLKIDIVVTDDEGQIQFYNVPGNNFVGYSNFIKDEKKTFEFTIVESSPTEIKINGDKFKLMKIYIVP